MAQNKVIENQTEILEAQADPIGIQAGIVLFNNKGKEEEPIYSPMYHGKYTDPIAYMVGRKPDKVTATGEATILMDGITFKVANSQPNKRLPIPIGAHKLLAEGSIRLTAIGESHKYDMIDIPLKEYALKCGYDVIPHDESDSELKRVKNVLSYVRAKFNKDANALFNISVPLKDPKSEIVMDYRLLAGKALIRNSYIHLEFTPRYADCIIKQRTLTQYPEALMKIDERNPNAYIMGKFMSDHYFMDSNQVKKSAQSLKVMTLLKYVDLPSVEEIKRIRRPWEERIKEPLEKCLDELVRVGLLKDWAYTHAKGKARTDEEANFKTYEDWIRATVYFDLINPPDQTNRLTANAEEKRKALEDKKARPKKKSKSEDKGSEKED